MDTQTVRKVAKLARLKLPEERVEALAGELGSIFKWIEQLNGLDTKNVQPMTSASALSLYLRPDVVTDGNKSAAITANAPDSMEGYFVVPKVVE
ncbi:MAG TPA: Asp-tRNA(Asn)/Glu-tRNA(Gln) amidotransferase subunit GatC [Alphaproteobacteria bacterium]